MTSALRTEILGARSTSRVVRQEGEPVPEFRPTQRGSGLPYLTPVSDSFPPYDADRSALTRLRVLTDLHRAAQSCAGTNGHPRPQVASNTAVPGWAREAGGGVPSTASSDLPPAQHFGQMLARAIVEAIGGTRPLAQLRTHCAPDVFAGLTARAGNLEGAKVSSVRICEPADGAAKVSAVYKTGRRARALAFRIQGLNGRWRITALQTA